MKLYFNKIVAHHFFSLDHVELDLRDRGYVAVEGVNHREEDAATSNGCGKCFGKGTKILMANGIIKKVEDIVIGDVVMGWDSTPRKVLETHSGYGKLYRVSGISKNHQNYSFICNENHLLCLKRTCGSPSKKELTINIPEFKKLPRYLQLQYNQYIAPVKTFYSNNISLKVNPYWLGVWLGDGTSLKPQITTMDKEIKDTCYEIAKHYNLRITTYVKNNGKATSYNIVSTRGKKGANGFVEDLKSIGVWGNKHIPEEYLTASYEERMALLCGILDTDGGKENKYVISITQAREKLANQIVFLARSLGFKTTLTKKIVKNYTNPYYRISIFGDTWKIPLRVSHKIVDKYKSQRPTTLGTYIEEIGNGNYYGFQIEGDGKFLLEDCLVVHNSSIFNSIVFALTGETINGVSKNISNIYFNDGCYVSLDFDINNTNYLITRYKDDPKMGSNLKIIINGEDKSGKGIRESQSILEQYIPDLNSTLLSSMVILGQGLPHKFTNNTPAGRKEVLEKLSKSDYMIDDLKRRVEKRNSDLKEKQLRILKEKEVTKSRIEFYETEIKNKQQELEVLNSMGDIKTLTETKNTQENLLNSLKKEGEEWKESQEDILSIRGKLDLVKNDLNKIEYDKRVELLQIKESKNAIITNYKNNIIQLESENKLLNKTIQDASNIKDTCPTCGQHIPNVFKPDVSKELDTIKQNNSLIEDYNKKIQELNNELLQDTVSISKKYEDKSSLLQKEYEELCNKINDYETTETKYNARILEVSLNIENIEKNINQLTSNLKNVQNSMDTLLSYIEEQNLNFKELEEKENIVNYRQSIISNMQTYLKRDFRGFLLSDIIHHIELKIKEYSAEVFNTSNIKFELDGNNINIEFQDKPYENLSGGEKQKVDIILLLAIRDMMCSYLDYSSNIIVLDEIFDQMDLEGCTRILELINKKLNDIDSIFIISHRGNELKIPYDSKLIIEKDERGVSNIYG